MGVKGEDKDENGNPLKCLMGYAAARVFFKVLVLFLTSTPINCKSIYIQYNTYTYKYIIIETILSIKL